MTPPRALTEGEAWLRMELGPRHRWEAPWTARMRWAIIAGWLRAAGNTWAADYARRCAVAGHML